MTDETDTPDSGTDNVAPSDTDTAEDWTYYDPDEDQDTVEEPEAEATDEGQSEADEEPEEDEPIEAVLERLKAENPKIAAHMAELEQGSLRQADYTRKTQALTNQRQALEAQVTRLDGIQDALVDHISKLIPPEPPINLAYSDPNAYVRQKAAYDAAVSQVQKLIEIGSQPKQMAEDLSEADRATKLQEENARLIERFPQTRTEAGRADFFKAAASAAMELGFSEAELQTKMDHREFALAYWARKGMDAEKARAKAKAKPAPVTPAKPGAQNAGLREISEIRAAKDRFKKGGRIEDAVRFVKWD
jgi:uncharacterized phage infection (PIP) family protein YhgE